MLLNERSKGYRLILHYPTSQIKAKAFCISFLIFSSRWRAADRSQPIKTSDFKIILFFYFFFSQENPRKKKTSPLNYLLEYSQMVGDQRSTQQQKPSTTNSLSSSSSLKNPLQSSFKKAPKILSEVNYQEGNNIKRPTEKKTSFSDMNSSSASLNNSFSSNKPSSRGSSRGTNPVSFSKTPLFSLKYNKTI